MLDIWFVMHDFADQTKQTIFTEDMLFEMFRLNFISTVKSNAFAIEILERQFQTEKIS